MQGMSRYEGGGDSKATTPGSCTCQVQCPWWWFACVLVSRGASQQCHNRMYGCIGRVNRCAKVVASRQLPWVEHPRGHSTDLAPHQTRCILPAKGFSKSGADMPLPVPDTLPGAEMQPHGRAFISLRGRRRRSASSSVCQSVCLCARAVAGGCARSVHTYMHTAGSWPKRTHPGWAFSGRPRTVATVRERASGGRNVAVRCRGPLPPPPSAPPAASSHALLFQCLGDLQDQAEQGGRHEAGAPRTPWREGAAAIKR